MPYQVILSNVNTGRVRRHSADLDPARRWLVRETLGSP
jgi:hypothetical protein